MNNYSWFKTVCFVLSLSLVFNLLPIVALAAEPAETQQASQAAPYYNDTNGHWAGAAIERWSDNGVLEGSDGRFRPDSSITRAELATVIDRMLQYRQATDQRFSDVSSDAWYYNSVRRVAATGVMQGAGDMLYPDNATTREETVAMLGRAFQMTGGTGSAASFADAGRISDWAAPIIRQMSDKGYVSGRPDGNFYPQDTITRAEVVQILDNMIAGYYHQPGEYKAPDRALHGNVLINADGVTISGLTINGNLYVAPGINGVTAFDNIHVGGTAFIQGGGSLVLQGNSSIHAMTAANAAIRAEANVHIGDLLITSPLTIEGDGKVDKAHIAKEGSGARLNNWPAQVVMGSGAEAVIQGKPYTNSQPSDVTVTPVSEPVSGGSGSSGSVGSGSSSESRSNNSNLSALSFSTDVGRMTLSPAFAAEIRQYTAAVSTAATKVTVSAGAADAFASVQIAASAGAVVTDNEVTLAASGDTTVTVKVTAESGDVTEYVTTFSKRLSHHSELSSIGIVTDSGAAALSPSFTPDNHTYTAAVSTTATKLTISMATVDAASTVVLAASGEGAIVTGNEVTLASSGPTTVTLQVTAADGTVSEYRVTVSKTLGHDSRLGVLGFSANIGSTALSPVFASDTFAYTAAVSSAATKVNVNASATDATAAVEMTASGTGASVSGNEITLAAGSATIITVKVTAADGASSTYTLTVNNTLNHDSSLNALGITADSGAAVLSPAFASTTYAYTVAASTAASKVIITALAADAGAVVTIAAGGTGAVVSGNEVTLASGGVTTITVKVTAADGTASEYTVSVSATLGYNSSLSALSFAADTGPSGLSPAFASAVYAYTVPVSTAATKVTVNAAAVDATSTMAITASGAGSMVTGSEVTLASGGTTTITVTVTAADSSSTAYVMTVSQTLSHDSSLSTLGLTPDAGTAALSPAFAQGILAYATTVPTAATKVTVGATAANPGATVTITASGTGASVTGNEVTLASSGTTTITVKVTAADSAFTSYTMTVEKLDTVTFTGTFGILTTQLGGLPGGYSTLGSGGLANIPAMYDGSGTLNFSSMPAVTAVSYTMTQNSILKQADIKLSNTVAMMLVGTTLSISADIYVDDDNDGVYEKKTSGIPLTPPYTGILGIGTPTEAYNNSLNIPVEAGSKLLVVYYMNAAGINLLNAVTGDLEAKLSFVQDPNPSSNSKLSALSLTSGAGTAALTPVFKAATTAYATTVPTAATKVTVGATTANPGASVIITASGTGASATGNEVTLATSGTTTITVKVTAADSTFTSYTVTVERLDTVTFTGTSGILTTLLGGLPGGYSVLGSGSGGIANLPTMYDGSGSLDFSAMPFVTAVAHTVTQNSILKQADIKLSNTLAMSLVGTTLSISADIYVDDDNDGVYEKKTSGIPLTPEYTGIIAIGTTTQGQNNSLNIPVEAGSKLLVVYYMNAAGLNLINAVTGDLEAKLSFVQDPNPSGNSKLSALSLTPDAGTAALTPVFKAATTAYATTVPTAATKVTVGAAAANPGASVTLTASGTGASVTSNEVTLATSGTTTITAKVTAADSTSTSYTITVEKLDTVTFTGTFGIVTTLLGGLPGGYSTLGSGGTANIPAIYDGSGTLDFSAMPSVTSVAYTMTQNSILKQADIKLSNTVAMSLVGTTLSISADIYVDDDNDGVYEKKTSGIPLTPPYTGVLAIGTTTQGQNNSLNIPVEAGSKLLVVYYMNAAGISLINAVTGDLEAKLSFVQDPNPSGNSKLSALSLTPNTGTAALTPVFKAATTAYATTVPTAATKVTVGATTANPGASVTITASGTGASATGNEVTLATGTTTITVKVTAADSSFTSYTVTVEKLDMVTFTGTSATLTTIAAGLTGLYSTLGSGGTANSLTVYNGSGTLDFSAMPSVTAMAHTVTQNSILKQADIKLSNTMALSLLGTTLSISADIYVDDDNDGVYEKKTSGIPLAPSYTGILAIGTTTQGQNNSLNIPVEAGSKLLVVYYMNATGLSLINAVTGDLEAKLSFVQDPNPSSNSKLNALSLTPDAGTAALTPVFKAATTAYTTTVPTAATKVTVGAAAANPGASVTITASGTGASVTSNEVTLASSGTTTITAKVTAADSSSTSYTVTVEKLDTVTFTGTSATLTTIAGGLTGLYSTLGSGGTANSLTVYNGSGTLDLSAMPSVTAVAHTVAQNSILKAADIRLSNTLALSLVGTTLSISADIYVDDDNDGVYEKKTSGIPLAPPYTGILATGTTTQGVNNSLSIPVEAGSKLLVVYYMNAAGLSLLNTVTGNLEAKLSFVQDPNPSSNSRLSMLSLTPDTGTATLTPVFKARTYAYATSVTSAVYAVTVNATASASGALISITATGTGASVTGSSVTLASSGPTTINVKVTAADSTYTVYTLTVNRIQTFTFTSTSAMVSTIIGGSGIYSVLGSGGGANSQTLYSTGPLNLSAEPALTAVAQPITRNGTLTQVEASFKNTIAQSLVGSTITVYADIYVDHNNDNIYEKATGVTLAPAYTGLVPIGETITAQSTGLQVPITAGSKLLVVYYAESMGIQMVTNLPGEVEANITIK
ncbi:hypothetical protein PAESOLCIP111_04603 [Paenibacillus solanacearum]|uniref:SLH domain-containing protein n=1 Tax=Paenibacillus solanacearum TaxID=2048548 RepID=A0A916K680_9BACL|nr:cadherin-like beta sandwich domain-containing protein [Paenibacillus solanacearum]CAG7644015.1 hypothetical protein PAESOLCIP111_04603 [Paenibacillus solanacearum]